MRTKDEIKAKIRQALDSQKGSDDTYVVMFDTRDCRMKDIYRAILEIEIENAKREFN